VNPEKGHFLARNDSMMKWLFIFSLILISSQAQFRPDTQFSLKRPTLPIWDELKRNSVDTVAAIDVIHQLLKALKSSSFPTAVAQNISQECIDDSVLYVHSYYNLSLWALQSK
jgi:hypothetical protein